jgi:hypothetical protein
VSVVTSIRRAEGNDDRAGDEPPTLPHGAQIVAQFHWQRPFQVGVSAASGRTVGRARPKEHYIEVCGVNYAFGAL